ncbi:ubiquitin C-terminal hydrolase Ubp14 [Ceratocystis pirilliformis]|uniref:Ubiquitin carboxyl-terminal hydrolase n=1 Tax=Ceratocystis pirilliformis TaxID=259994 RepID=A0ABR3ZRE5_9PEZI
MPPPPAKIALEPPRLSQSVYREDCTQCFDSIDDKTGLDVCLQCFNGGCTKDRSHAALHASLRSHPLVANIRRVRKVVEREEPPLKMSKLAIAAETDADRYDTIVVARCLECNLDIDKTSEKLEPVISGLMKANTFSRQEEVKAWELELNECEHVICLEQDMAKEIKSGDLGHCTSCDLHENLWLCLQCGNLGCGRKQLGGVDGNSHGLAHATESGHGVAVKLGSITPEGNADVYCYKCDEERIDRNLAAHLANWGIKLADRQKTEKSLTELQIEQNLRWDFSMTTSDGLQLLPIFGAGLTGLKNLGNSCYLASILQCLFALPAFKERYYKPDDVPPNVFEPAADLETQLQKIADGLLSGRYSKPDESAMSQSPSPLNNPEQQAEPVHQRGIAPSMLKHLVGRGHGEFSTMRQQDAFELLQHLFTLITRASKADGTPDPTLKFRFALEQRLQCISCKKVRYSTIEQDSIFVDVPKDKIEASEDNEDKKDVYRPVALKECLDRFTGEEMVDLTCAACSSKDGYIKRQLFKTFPEVLVINASKMTVVNWVPVKVDVPVIMPLEPFLMDEYMSKGLQADEEELPEEKEPEASVFIPDATAMAMLEGMGFPPNRCHRGLHATGNNDANAAMEWIFAHMDDADIDSPLVLSSGSGAGPGAAASMADPEKIQMLTDMGFAVPQAKKALRETGADMEGAVTWLFSHPDDPGDDGSETVQQQSSANEAKDPCIAGSPGVPAKFQLQSLVCHKGTSIHTGHYVAFIRKQIEGQDTWVLFNDEKIVKAVDADEMAKFAYVYFLSRV